MLEARFGSVLNIHGEMAHSPAMLNGYAALQGAIREHGTFDPATREAIALAVAAVDDCSYCQAAHTVAGRAAGLSVEMTIAARTGGAGRTPGWRPSWPWPGNTPRTPAPWPTERGPTP